MKRITIIICSTVWSGSLLTAYYIGARTQSDSTENSNTTAQSVLSTQSKGAQPAAPKVAGSEDKSAIAAYLDGEAMMIDAALSEIHGLSDKNTRALLEDAFSLSVSDPNRSRVIRELLSELAETHPMVALEMASQIQSLRDSERARTSILEVWGRNDPNAAIAWAKDALAGEPSRARSSQLSAIYRGYAASAPAAAFQQALAITDDNRIRNRLLGEVIETQVQTGDIANAKLAVDSLTDPDIQSSLRRELVDEWASFDPQAAANYVSSLGENASSQLKNTLISEWAESDPSAAAAWLSTLAEDDPAVARASASIIQEWSRYDLTASAEWLNSQPASPELDRAVISYTMRAAEEDPASAMSWAESIDDDRRRTWMMGRVANSWKEQDAASFNTYLDSSDLTQEQRALLENAQSDRGGRGRNRD